MISSRARRRAQVKVSKVLETLNDLPLDTELAIQWYTREDVEGNLNRKITRESSTNPR